MTRGDHDELGLEEVAGELQLYASQAPRARPDLAYRVMASVGEARTIGRPTSPAERHPRLLMRLGSALRPVQVRSLLAAAALVAVVGVGAVVASGGALPFQLPTVGGPGAPNPSPQIPPSIEPDAGSPAGPNATPPVNEHAGEAPGSPDNDEADEADGHDEPEDEASDQDDESATDDPDEEDAVDADDASETERPSESHQADGDSDDGRSDEESAGPGGSPQAEDAPEDD